MLPEERMTPTVETRKQRVNLHVDHSFSPRQHVPHRLRRLAKLKKLVRPLLESDRDRTLILVHDLQNLKHEIQLSINI